MTGPVVVEQTAKRWKGMQLAGALGVVGGVLFVVMGFGATGIISFIFGVALYIAGRMGAWWNHG